MLQPRHRSIAKRSYAPLGLPFLQLTMVGFLGVGVSQICLLGSDGVVRPNTLLKVTLPHVQSGSLWRFNDHCDYIVIGWPLDGSNAPRFQLNDQFGSLEDIDAHVRSHRYCHYERLPPKRTMIIYADARTPMEIVTSIKQEMRRANQLRVCYAVNASHY